ncbi:hypothetical protein Spb1_08070 [Planctopirus ephydatiae]|uniref:Uncharacterized protein n=1 Tax=Planctopirus ephydatiae TaxID=2528019 RepID=A0A518GK21_9PLAN|nr:hypothetical protein Spb1_08070 [Planctopirus ephydatiae]
MADDEVERSLNSTGYRELLGSLFRWTLLPSAQRRLMTDNIWLPLKQAQKTLGTELVRTTASEHGLSQYASAAHLPTTDLLMHVLMSDGIMRVWSSITLADHQSALSDDLIAVERLVLSLSQSQQQLMVWAYRTLQKEDRTSGFSEINLFRKRYERWVDILISCTCSKHETALEWGYDSDSVADFLDSFAARPHPLATVLSAGWENFLESVEKLTPRLMAPLPRVATAFSGISPETSRPRSSLLSSALRRIYNSSTRS